MPNFNNNARPPWAATMPHTAEDYRKDKYDISFDRAQGREAEEARRGLAARRAERVGAGVRPAQSRRGEAERAYFDGTRAEREDSRHLNVVVGIGTSRAKMLESRNGFPSRRALRCGISADQLLSLKRSNRLQGLDCGT